jgi:hypothetical protein
VDCGKRRRYDEERYMAQNANPNADASGESATRFLAVSHNTGDPAPYAKAEAARTAELQQEGLIDLALLKADLSGAVFLLRADDLASAQKILDSMPLVAHGITSVELTGVVSFGTLPGW